MTKNGDRKKTPSARVIAAMWIVRQLDDAGYAPTLTPEALSELAGSRVNGKKSDKVDEYLRKLAGKFIDRMAKIVDRFENPPPKAAKKPETAEGVSEPIDPGE